jgi:IS30 family transposase
MPAGRGTARRPKTAKLAGDAELRDWVQRHLDMKWSPEQISARLKAEFPRRRTGRALRKPRRTGGERRGRIRRAS